MSLDWPDRRILDLFGIDLPVLQAPMAFSSTPQMAVAVSEAGGLGALPCAQYSADEARTALDAIRAATKRPINLNFFCHAPPAPDPERMAAWRRRLAPYAVEMGLDPETPFNASNRAPFDGEFCKVVEDYRPEVVSFHFGLPDDALLARVRAAGARIISSATTVAEARWLEARGVDAVIAMGAEAGGHRGAFLDLDMAGQPGTFALVPQVADAVSVPVIAAGGIADGRGVAAALMLGAAAVQVGTAYLFSPEAKVSAVQRQLLENADDRSTRITNVFTGRPARGVSTRLVEDLGPLAEDAPAFPMAGGPLAPIRAKAEASGVGDFTNQWAGQAARLSPHLPAGELTRKLAEDGYALLRH